MGVRTFFALLVLVLGGLFAWLNWPEVTRTAPLSLGFTRVEAPLGLVLLVALGVVTLLYLLFTLGLGPPPSWRCGATLGNSSTTKSSRRTRSKAASPSSAATWKGSSRP